MPFTISINDVFYAAVMALVFTWLFKALSRVFKAIVTRSTEFDFHPSNLDTIMEKCCSMFPNEIVRFNGSTFKRGMLLKVITSQHRTIEGQLIGLNDENMVCFITRGTVIAQELDKIDEMEQV